VVLRWITAGLVLVAGLVLAGLGFLRWFVRELARWED
jgi:hypothetical protein